MKKRLLLGAALIGFFTAQAQLSENFEGSTFPPAGWELESINPVTWEPVNAASLGVPLNGLQSVGLTYDEDLAPQDESLISPTVILPSGAPTLTFLTSLSYYWSVDPNDNYDFIVSISTNDGASWTAIWDETDLGEFTSFATQSVSIPLANYAGQSVKFKFQYAGTDGAQLVLDDVAVITCAVPTTFSYTEPATTTTVNIGWVAPANSTPTGYEFEYGVDGYTQGSGTLLTPTTPSANLTQLQPSTEYDFYVRTNCGNGDYSEWVGPVSFGTEFDAATPNYAFGFENENNAGGWSSVVEDEASTAWEITAQDEEFIFAQEGENLALVGASGTDSDAWLFSRGLNLTAGQVYTITYYLSKVIGAGAGGVNSITTTIGTDLTAAAQSTNLATFADFQQEEYTLQTHTFTPTTSGIYYVGFNYTAPAHAQDDFGLIALDNFAVTGGTNGRDEQLASQFSVQPNPATTIVNVNANNGLINSITVTDLNGRTVKTGKFTGVATTQVNVSDLASGVYMMTISSDKGNVTKKIVKN